MILDLLTIAGITIIISRGSLFRPFRDCVASGSEFFGNLVSCPMCLSVWIGVIFIFLPESVKSALYYPFIGSLSTYFVYLIIERIKIR